MSATSLKTAKIRKKIKKRLKKKILDTGDVTQELKPLKAFPTPSKKDVLFSFEMEDIVFSEDKNAVVAVGDINVHLNLDFMFRMMESINNFYDYSLVVKKQKKTGEWFAKLTHSTLRNENDEYHSETINFLEHLEALALNEKKWNVCYDDYEDTDTTLTKWLFDNGFRLKFDRRCFTEDDWLEWSFISSTPTHLPSKEGVEKIKDIEIIIEQFRKEIEVFSKMVENDEKELLKSIRDEFYAITKGGK